VRDPVDVLRVGYVLWAVVLTFQGNIGGTVRLLLTAAAVTVPRLLNMPRPFDIAFILGMTTQAFGNTGGLFERYAWYDTFVHCVLPMVSAPTAYVALIRLEVLADFSKEHRRHTLVGVFLITVMLAVALGAIYELYEYAADHLLGSQLQHGNTDTITDLAADGAGGLLGGALMAIWARFGWTTTRRVPPRRARWSS
jgi:hypothetical protein